MLGEGELFEAERSDMLGGRELFEASRKVSIAIRSAGARDSMLIGQNDTAATRDGSEPETGST